MKKNINLIKLFKLYNNRPNHLVKYLIEKNAFREAFLKSLNKISNVKEIKDEEIVFNSIDEMNDYFDVFNFDTNKKVKKYNKKHKDKTPVKLGDPEFLNGQSVEHTKNGL